MADEIDKLRAILEQDPTDKQAFISLCEIAQEEKDHACLAELYTFRAQVIDDDREAADLCLQAGDIYINNINDMPQGVQVLLRGFECDRTHDVIGKRLGEVYREAEDWEAALAIVQQRIEALTESGDREDKKKTLARLHQQAGEIFHRIYDDHEEALNHYLQALELDDANLLALCGAREIYNDAGQYKEAALMCEQEARAEEEPERRIVLWRELSHISAEHLSDRIGAVYALKQALKVESASDEVKLDLAHAISILPPGERAPEDEGWAVDCFIKRASGVDVESEEKLELAELALKLAPQNTKAIQFVEAKISELGAIEELVELYQEVLAEIPDLERQAPVIRRLAKLFLGDLGSPVEALAWLIKLEPLGIEQDLKAIAQISTGVEIRASQMPEFTANPNEVDEFGALPEVEGVDEDTDIRDDVYGQVQGVSASSIPPVRPSLIPPGRNKYIVPEGMSTEQAVTQLHLLAEAARQKGDDPAAEQHMVQVIDCDPYDQKATTFLERRFRAQGDWSSLRDLLLQSIGSPHYEAAARTVRLREAARISEEHLDDPDGAIDVWQIIRQSDSKVRDAGDALMRLLSKLERWEEVLDIIEEDILAIQSRTNSIAGYRRMADIYRIRLGDSVRAAEVFNRILELEPDDEEALDALDEIYLREQNYKELVVLLTKRVELTRDVNEKRNYLLRAAATLDQRLGKSDEAYELLQQLLTISSGDDEALEIMERMDRLEERWEQLIHVLSLRAEAAIDQDKKTDFWRTRAPLVAEHAKEAGAAVRAWLKVLEITPDDKESLVALATIHSESGNWKDLVEILEKQVATETDDRERAELFRQIARVQESKLEAAEDAMESWHKVIDLEEDIESLGALSRYYETTNDWKNLAAMLERQIPHIVDDGARARALCRKAAIIEEKLGDRVNASLELLRAINKFDPTCAPAYQRLAEIYLKDGTHDKAVDALEQQIAHTHENLEVKALYIKLGDWSHSKLDDLTRSMEAYEQAYRMDPKDESVIDLLDDSYSQLEQWDRLLKLIQRRFQDTDDVSQKSDLIMRGALIAEEKLTDFKQSWSWYKAAYESVGQVEGTIGKLEEAAQRMELWNELNELYGFMARKADRPDEQVTWWLKIADVFQEKLADPSQALEAVLRAFGLTPENMDLLDRVDELSVKAENWERLAMVYQVLEGRLTESEDKIELLIRYANVLLEKGDQPSQAFDVGLKAFELDPHREDLLEMVEQIAKASHRWKDLVRVYNVCAKISEDVDRKVDLKLREVACLRDNLENRESALATVFETLRINPLDEDVARQVWAEVDTLEDGSEEPQKGEYWDKLIAFYRTFLKTYRKDKEKLVEVLLAIAQINIEKLSDKKRAFKSIKEAQQINPKDEGLVDKLEEMARENDFWEELIAHYADILDETFEMDVAAMIHRRRGRILEEELNRLEDAAEHYWQIIQLDPSDLSSYDKLIMHYEKVEKWNELVNLFERQLDNTHDKDEKKEILFRVASVWENQIGNMFEARDWYEQILTLWPDEENAKAGVDRVLKESRVPDDGIEEEATDADEMAAEEIDTGDDEDVVIPDEDAEEKE